MTGNELQRYTAKDLELARTKGQVIGWVQGGLAVVVGSMVLHALGWIPAIALVAGVGFLAYKLTSK